MADVPGFAPDNPKPIKKGRADWHGPKGKVGKGPMIGCTLIALCVVGGAIVAFLTSFGGGQVEPFLVTVPVSEYVDPAWPPNAWAEKDSDLLAGCFKDRNGQDLSAKMYNSQQQDKFTGLLDLIAKGTVEQAATGQPSKPISRPLVVHVTALAVARNGTVYLLPADAKPDNPATWVPVEKVLDAVNECRSTKHKLLVLDLAKPVANPFNGFLRNDAAAQLHAQLAARKATNPLNYPVLTSCAPGETAGPADPAKCTAFALALADGLNGAADIYNDSGKGNGEVTVSELARFVAARVYRYAKTVRNARQTPLFYTPGGPDADFVVARGTAKKLESLPTTRGAYPIELRNAWAYRDDEGSGGTSRGYPLAFARLTGGIVRAEQRWLGSDNVDRANLELTKAKILWQAQVPRSGRGDPAADKLERVRAAVGTVRLVVAGAKAPPPPADWGPALDAYLTARLGPKLAADKPDDAGKLREAWLSKAKADPLGAGLLVWDRARTHVKPKRADLAAYAEAMKELKDHGLKPDYSEVVLLRTLAARNFREEQGLLPDPGYAVARLLEAEHELGLTLAPGPDGWDVARAKLESSEQARAAGQAALFTAGDSGKLAVADAKLKEAIEGLIAARAIMTAWARANQALQESTEIILATMPAALAWDVPSLTAWEAAVDVAEELANRLAMDRRNGSFLPLSADDMVKDVQRKSQDLKTAVGASAADKLVKENRPRNNPAALAPWQAVAAATLAPPDSRKAMWDVVNGETTTFHTKARAEDEKDFDSLALTPNPPPLSPGDPETIDAAKRVRVNSALFRLGGFAKAADYRARSERVTTSGSATDYETLGDDLRKVWVVEWPEQLKKATVEGRWADVARLARATPPGATTVAATGPAPPGDPPAVKAVDTLVQAYVTAACNQFKTDEGFRARDDASKTFYAEATNLAPR